jgi:hypothetical protein
MDKLGSHEIQIQIQILFRYSELNTDPRGLSEIQRGLAFLLPAYVIVTHCVIDRTGKWPHCLSAVVY